MEQGSSDVRQSNDKSFLLKWLMIKQKENKEGTPAWYSCQQEINQIVAERYLQYLNR